MGRRLLVPVLFGLVCLSCKPTDEPPEPPPTPDGFVLGPEVVCDAPYAGFDRLTEDGAARGLTEPMSDPEEVFGFELQGRGGGLLVTDLEADGDLDLVATHMDKAPGLFVNDGDGHFALLEPPLEVPSTFAASQALVMAAADITGDGLPELFAAGGGFVSVWPNAGALQFGPPEDLYNAIGQGDAPVILSLAFGDIDGDADLDLALACVGMGDGIDPGSMAAPGSADLVLLNHDGVFERALDLVSQGDGSTTQVVTFTDRDNDGDADLYIPADLGPPSAFWRNDGVVDGLPVLENDAPQVGAGLLQAAMGLDAADLNGDGWLDYCMSDVGPPRCLVSDGAGAWFEGAAAMGLEPDDMSHWPPTVGWGFDFADLDNDGHLDALMAGAPEAGTHAQGMHDIPDLVWRGQDGQFEDVTEELGFGNPWPNQGVVSADFDGDGWLDVAVAGPAVPPSLFMNRCGAEAWIEIELEGPPANAEGFGARVEVDAGGRVHVREVLTVRGQNQGPSRQHFGLGSAEAADRVTVRWPDGRVSEALDVPPRRRVTVLHEAAGQAPDPGDDDDDDATPPDDDDVTDPPGPGEILITGRVFEPGSGLGLEDALVWSSACDDCTTRTFGTGEYMLVVPEDTEMDVHVEADGMLGQFCAVDTTWQNGMQTGMAHPITDAEGLDNMYDGALGASYDAADATLWLAVTSPGGDPVVGAQVAIDPLAATGPYLLSSGQSEQSDVVAADTIFVIWPAVAPGPVTITVAPPDDVSCQGRGEAVMEAGTLTVVNHQCQ